MDRFRLRRWWYQVHRWIGLTLAVLIVPVSLSGAALVWHDALDRAIHPQRFAITGATMLPAQAYVAAARARLHRGDRIAQLTATEAGGPVTIAAAPAAAPPRPGPPLRTIVYIDPPTARVLDVAASDAGPVRFLYGLHGSLQVPGVGRTIVGWLGIALLVSCLSGLWLWWPTVGRWTRGLRWRRRGDVNANLHHLIGFWIALPLAMLALTGAWISFPRAFGLLVGEGSGPPRAMPARPTARTTLPVDVAVARALHVTPGAVRAIIWPTERTPDWTIRIGDGAVLVADDGGVAVRAPAPPVQRGVAGAMRRIHDGEGTGAVWQAVIFVTGLLPAVLAATGIVMWWRGRRSPNINAGDTFPLFPS